MLYVVNCLIWQCWVEACGRAQLTFSGCAYSKTTSHFHFWFVEGNTLFFLPLEQTKHLIAHKPDWASLSEWEMAWLDRLTQAHKTHDNCCNSNHMKAVVTISLVNCLIRQCLVIAGSRAQLTFSGCAYSKTTSHFHFQVCYRKYFVFPSSRAD